MSRVRALVITAGLALLGACNDDAVSADEGETGEELIGGPARGISIVAVEANQGTGVTLTNGEVYVESSERNAYLISERDTLLRFQHVIDDPDGWIPRELIGRLTVYPPDDGEPFVRERRMFVEADSDPRSLPSNFFFSLLASEAQVGSRFQLELREADAQLDVSGLGEGVVLVPEQPQPFGFESVPAELKVVLVPVEYRWTDPPRLAVPSAEDIQLFHDDLLQQNPVRSVDIQVRGEPLIWDEHLTNLGELLVPTAAIKMADNADANVYYHALVDVGGPSVNMVAGIAWLTDDSKDDSFQRVAATVLDHHVKPGDEETGEPPIIYPATNSSRTMVHEIGHNQGLSHVYCPGADSAGPDPSFPYADGKIGVYGFGIRNFHIYTPNAAHDYMSYCGNSWVSDWTWNKTFMRVRELTSWDYEGPASSPVTAAGPVLTGLVYEDGSEDWWLLDDPAPIEGGGAERLEFWRGGALVATSVAEIELLSDGRTRVIRASLPAKVSPPAAGTDAIVRVDHLEVRRPLDLDRLRRP